MQFLCASSEMLFSPISYQFGLQHEAIKQRLFFGVLGRRPVRLPIKQSDLYACWDLGLNFAIADTTMIWLLFYLMLSFAEL